VQDSHIDVSGQLIKRADTSRDAITPMTLEVTVAVQTELESRSR